LLLNPATWSPSLACGIIHSFLVTQFNIATANGKMLIICKKPVGPEATGEALWLVCCRPEADSLGRRRGLLRAHALYQQMFIECLLSAWCHLGGHEDSKDVSSTIANSRLRFQNALGGWLHPRHMRAQRPTLALLAGALGTQFWELVVPPQDNCSCPGCNL
jgi:hypothetical protein